MPEESEAVTRRERVDRVLSAAGWTPIVGFSKGSKYDSETVKEYETSTGPADYVLFDRGEALAAVEAKKLTVGPQGALTQAQRYSRGFRDGPFDFSGFRIPFVYSTNGEIIWFQDLRVPDSRSREVKRFHTRGALREMLERDDAAALRWLQTNPVDNPYLRPYQKEAIEAVECALAQKKRKMLVAMATGTGKTYTIIALIYRLMKSGLARRVLFLVDRRALAAQAVGATASFDAEPGLKFNKTYEVYSQRFRREDLDEEAKFDPKVLPTKYLTEPQPGNSFVYISTIQRMRINLFGWPEDEAESGDMDAEEDAEKLDIPIHAFDLVIADECHRG